jgi:ABC-type multidrug transport system ATPase subunit
MMTDTHDSSAATSTDGQTCLTASGLTREFGSLTVIDDVSLSLQRGSLHALIGPNGCGKTTLLRLLADLLAPTDGTVSYEVEDAVRQIGYLPQRPAFRPTFTAQETLEFYASLVDDDAEALLSRVGLSDAADRRVDELSGGMIRLLGLAQATAGDPPIVLLDEPGSGLDPQMRKTTIGVARALADEGTGVLYSTHDLAMAEEFADRVTLVDAGVVAATGSPEALTEEYDAATLQEVFEAAVEGSSETVAVIGETDG